MPNTDLGLLPTPADTDPLSGAAAAIRALADALDQRIVVKTVSESVNNSTTLQADDELLFNVKAGKVYAFEFHLLFDCASATPDLKVAVGRSTTGPLTWSTAATGANGTDAQTDGIFEGDSGDSVSVGIHNAPTGVHIFGIFTPDTDGTITLRWAQLTATATNTTLKRGSYLRAQVVPA